MRYHKGSVYGGDTMIGRESIKLGRGFNLDIFNMFCSSLKKRKNKKTKEPKGKAEDGSYCPKKKVGMSWAYNKETFKEESDEQEGTN